MTGPMSQPPERSLRTLHHPVIGTDVSDQQRGRRIVELRVLERFIGIRIRVAVPAPVHARVIGPDVPGLDAVASLAHPPVLPRGELDAVCPSQDVQRHASGCPYPVPREIPVRTAGLYDHPILRGDPSEALCDPVPVILGHGDDLGHVPVELPVHLDEAEDAAVDVRGHPPAHVRERIQMTTDRVFVRQQDWVVSPGDPLSPDRLGELHEGVDAVVHRRNTGLHIPAVRRDRVVEVRVEAVRYLVQPGQDRTVVLRTEHHAVNHRGVQLIAYDGPGEQGVARHDVPLGEAVEKPIRVVLDGVRPASSVDYHGHYRRWPPNAFLQTSSSSGSCTT